VFTEEGKSVAQKEVDQLADVFVDRVARNMNVSRDLVLSDFGQGGILLGQTAVDKGMAHRLGSLENLISELNQGKKTMTKTTTTGSNTSLMVALTGDEKVSAKEIVTTLTEHRPDVIRLLNPEPETALSAAEAIATACAEKGVPALSASLLTAGMSKDEALARIDMAAGLKDKLTASGLESAFDTIAQNLDDPIKMVGKAIFAAQAENEENRNITREAM
jgi:ClpP class serine protease